MTRWARARKALAIAGVAAVMLTAGGCFKNAIRRVDEGNQIAPRKEATREQLIAMLEERMGRLATLRAKCPATAIRQDITIPATVLDYNRQQHGRPYRKRFPEGQINARLWLSRSMDGQRKVRLSGDVADTMGGMKFILLGQNNDFWVMLPNTAKDAGEKKNTMGTVYRGTVRRESVRPKGVFSMRPQDVIDLFLTDEVYAVIHEGTICYMETWPDYYILNFLRPDWPEHIYSKIWIERENLRMRVHQLFDGAGELVAEARFDDYKPVTGKGSNLTIEFPTLAEIIWPRDQMVLQAEISSIELNPEMDSKIFEVAIPRGYDVKTIQELLEQRQSPQQPGIVPIPPAPTPPGK